jgi:hypothetical protein
MPVYHTKSLQINLIPDLAQIWVVCLDTIDSEDFKNCLTHALEIAKTNNIRQWGIDARNIGELSDTDERWIQTEFFPYLMDKDSTCYIAMVVSPKCYDRMLQENGWFGLKSYNSFIKINTFYNIQDAETWLQSHNSD